MSLFCWIENKEIDGEWFRVIGEKGKKPNRQLLCSSGGWWVEDKYINENDVVQYTNKEIFTTI